MQDAADSFTLDMLGGASKRGRGRPRIANPLTPAERARNYRSRQRHKKSVSQRLKAQGVTHFYRNKQTGQTWSGRGLMPKWMAVQVREGVDKDFFKVAV